MEASTGLAEEFFASVAPLVRILVSSGARRCLSRKSGSGPEARICELDLDLVRAHGNGADRSAAEGSTDDSAGFLTPTAGRSFY